MPRDSRRLGRGLQSLLQPTVESPQILESPRKAVAARTDSGIQAETHQIEVETPSLPPSQVDEVEKHEASPTAWAAVQIPIENVQPRSDQPRRVFNTDSIASLARSISHSGIVQPLIVRRDGVGLDGYQIIAGERRWRAAKAAGLAEVPAIVRVSSDRQAAEVSLIENIQREDLNAIDRAEAYEAYCNTNGVAPDDLAATLGEDRSTVSNYLRMLDLPDSVKALIRDGQLGMGHARCLLGVSASAGQEKLAREAVEKGLSVRAVENTVRQWKANRHEPSLANSASRSDPKAKRPQVAHLEEAFQQALGTKVTIKEGRRRGAGKILIEYYTLDDFDRIAECLGVGE